MWQTVDNEDKIEADKENLLWHKRRNLKGPDQSFNCHGKRQSEKNNDHEKNLLQCAVSQKNPSEMRNRENIQLLPPKIFREEKQ